MSVAGRSKTGSVEDERVAIGIPYAVAVGGLGRVLGALQVVRQATEHEPAARIWLRMLRSNVHVAHQVSSRWVPRSGQVRGYFGRISSAMKAGSSKWVTPVMRPSASSVTSV